MGVWFVGMALFLLDLLLLRHINLSIELRIFLLGVIGVRNGYWLCQPQTLIINREHFWFGKFLEPLRRSRFTGKTSTIINIFQEQLPYGLGDQRMVIILETSQKEYTLGQGLYPAEQLWIISEIQAWLKQNQL